MHDRISANGQDGPRTDREARTDVAVLSVTHLKGLRVLLVEDQMIIALQIESVLREVGCNVIGPVGTLHTAMILAQEAALDAAVLDINLDGKKSFPVAEELQRRNIPIIFATGYGASVLPEQWGNLPCLCKPFQGEQLEQLMKERFGRWRRGELPATRVQER